MFASSMPCCGEPSTRQARKLHDRATRPPSRTPSVVRARDRASACPASLSVGAGVLPRGALTLRSRAAPQHDQVAIGVEHHLLEAPLERGAPEPRLDAHPVGDELDRRLEHVLLRAMRQPRLQRIGIDLAVEIERPIVEEAERSGLDGADPDVVGHVALDPLPDLEMTLMGAAQVETKVEADDEQRDQGRYGEPREGESRRDGAPGAVSPVRGDEREEGREREEVAAHEEAHAEEEAVENDHQSEPET